MIKASNFALSQNHALLENMHELVPEKDHPKAPIYLMTGDPTKFGHEACKMSEEGYEIVRQSIRANNNHSYVSANGTAQAKEAIAKHFGHGKNLTQNDVIITAGVNQGLLYTLLAIADQGQNILVPEIGYPFFDSLAPSFGVEVRKYPLLRENNWQIDLKALPIDENTSFLFLINPSNPCGSVFSKEHVQQIINYANDHHLLIVADEVYYNMTFDKFTSFGELATDGPVITLSGVEKMFFVPGWQTAWVIFYDKLHVLDEIKAAYNNVCQLWLHSNVFLMNSLPALLDTLTLDFGKQKCQLFKENHDYLVHKLSTIPQLTFTPAQGAFYIPVFLELGPFKSDVEFCQELLKEENIMLLPLSWNGSQKFQGFRMIIIATKELYDDLFQRLQEFITKKYK